LHEKLLSLLEAWSTINPATTGLGLMALAILLLGALFGGFAATGAIARTATNIRNGATSPLTGIVHSLFLVTVILLLAPVASDIPLCCLSAILFVVAWNMSEVRHFLRIIRGAPRPDVAVLLLTFLLTVFVDLVVAVNVGVILAALLFMRRMSDAVSIEPHTRAPASEFNAVARAGDAGVVIYSIEGPFFFGAAEKLERSLQHVQRRTTTLVLRLGNVPFVDATGIFALEEILADFKRNGAAVLFTEVRPNVLYKLERGGLIDLIGKENVFESLSEALVRAEQSGTAS
jgi:SulP family sulfate permease